MTGDSQEAVRFSRRYVNLLFASCTVLWVVLALARGYVRDDWRMLLGLFLLWGVVWSVDAFLVPRLFSQHLRYLHTYGKKARARVLRKHRVLTLGMPVVSVALLGVGKPKLAALWCLALPSQFRNCRVGDDVDVVYLGSGNSGSAVRGCLFMQPAEPSTGGSGSEASLRRLRPWHIVELAAILLIVATAGGLLVYTCRARPQEAVEWQIGGKQVNRPKAELRLAVTSATPPQLDLLLELRNVGDVPIKVDKELVFLLYLSAVDAQGRAVEWKGMEGVPYPGRESVMVKVLGHHTYLSLCLRIRPGISRTVT